MPFGLVPQGLQAGAGPASPHLDVGEGYTAGKGHKLVSSTAAIARKNTDHK